MEIRVFHIVRLHYFPKRLLSLYGISLLVERESIKNDDDARAWAEAREEEVSECVP
jgi:hypothetical protein